MSERAVAFDWGGVFTVGTFDGRSTARLAAAYGLDVAQVRRHYFDLVARLELGEWSLPQFWTEFGGRLGLGSVPYGDFEALYLGSVLENEAMYAFLPTLHAHYRVGLLSNNYPVVCDSLRKDHRWARFDALVFSNEIGVKKPDPRAYQALSEALAVPPERTVFVDDVAENLAPARALGFSTIHFTGFEAFLEEFRNWERRG